MKRVIITLLLVLLLLVGCSPKDPNDYVVCGITAQCPDTHKSLWIGGQCVRCYHNDGTQEEFEGLNNICINLCEEYCDED